MKFLVASPDNPYYLWQILVQINNFKKLGIDQDTIFVLSTSTHNDKIKIFNNIDCKSKFYIYDDTRINSHYSVTLRHHILKKFFKEHGHEYAPNETFLLLDPDVIFINKMDFTPFLNDDIWYLSDTRSYIDSGYIKSKGEMLFNEMCEIVGLTPEIVSGNDQNAGGAQYMIKNITAEFWEKSESDCEKLYKHMTSTQHKYCPEFPIQFWTADMWSLLWNAWYFGHETKIVKEFDFCWATDGINRWSECNIFHNAGATPDRKDLFVKTDYQSSPFNKDFSHVSENFASYNYIKEIKETENNFKNLIW